MIGSPRLDKMSQLYTFRMLLILSALHAVAHPTGQVTGIDWVHASFASNASAKPILASKLGAAVAGSLRYVENSGICGERSVWLHSGYGAQPHSMIKYF